jgi:hypothetical protein
MTMTPEAVGVAAGRPGIRAIWLFGVAAAAALAVSVYNYFAPVSLLAPDASIAGTAGALLVGVSTALLLLAAVVLGFWQRANIIYWVFVVAALLDIVGTAFAGYMLDSLILVALMAVAFVGWLWFVTSGRRPQVSR